MGLVSVRVRCENVAAEECTSAVTSISKSREVSVSSSSDSPVSHWCTQKSHTSVLCHTEGLNPSLEPESQEVCQPVSVL